MNDVEQIKKQNRQTFILLLLAFLLPVIAAYLVYLNMHGPVGKTKNNGELIIPARPLDGLKLNTLDGKPFGIEQLKGKWHLLYIGHGPCQQACRDRLSTMHQTRMGQGADMSRVALIYLAVDPGATPDLANLKNDYARLTVISGDQTDVGDALKLFQTDNDIKDDDLIYMIDPLGNLMMRYTSKIHLIGIVKDLEHLLKISHIG